MNGLAVLVLRYTSPGHRDFQVPFNFHIRGVQIPVGLGLITLMLFSLVFYPILYATMNRAVLRPDEALLPWPARGWTGGRRCARAVDRGAALRALSFDASDPGRVRSFCPFQEYIYDPSHLAWSA